MFAWSSTSPSSQMLLKASPQGQSMETVLLCIVLLSRLISAAYGELGNQSVHSAQCSPEAKTVQTQKFQVKISKFTFILSIA